ncbi:MAG: nucleotidyltransferase family protein [Acidobacteria bacterium]|nr:nucleotidyltransferase family protein [Acidobacteriota bacterium]
MPNPFTDFPGAFWYGACMARAPGFCGVILAAGESTRMGSDKALLPWPPASVGVAPGRDTFLSSSIRSLLEFCGLVLVVAGKNDGRLEPAIYASNASLVRNPDPERGQFSSLQAGLQEVLNRGRDSAIVTLVDRPPVRSATLAALRDAYIAAPREIWAVVPDYEGKHGHPFIAGRELIHRFLEAPASSNAREIEHQHQAHIAYLRVDDPFAVANIDTPEDYSCLRN